jgi:hypothetical protein
MKEREARDVLNDYGRPPVAESRDDKVSIMIFRDSAFNFILAAQSPHKAPTQPTVRHSSESKRRFRQSAPEA